MLKVLIKLWLKTKVKWYQMEYDHYNAVVEICGVSDSDLIEALSDAQKRLQFATKELSKLM